MRLENISLEGFGSYRDRVEVDLRGLEFTGVVGANYSGKSTLIFDALAWCLFAWTRQDLTGGEVINRGSSKAVVEVAFTLGGVGYRMVRTLTASGRHEATLYAADADGGWDPVTDKHPGETNRAVVDLLGMGATSAMATWMVQQNDFDALLSAKPSARRDILVEVFNLGRYQEWSKAAGERRKTCLEQAGAAGAVIDTISQSLADIDAADEAAPFATLDDEGLAAHGAEVDKQVEQARQAAATGGDLDALTQAANEADQVLVEEEARHSQALGAWQAALEQARSTATQSRQAAQRALDDARGRMERARQDVGRATSVVSECAQAEADLSMVRERADQAAQDVQVRESEAQALREREGGLRERIAALEARITQTRQVWSREHARIEQIRVTVREGNGECFTCHQPLTSQAADELLASQEALLEQVNADGETLSGEKRTLEGEADDLAGRAQRAQAMVAQARRALEDLQRRVTVLAERAASLPQAEADLAEASARLEEARTLVSDTTTDLDEAIVAGEEQVRAAQENLDANSAPSPALERARKNAQTAREALDAAQASDGPAVLRQRLEEATVLQRQVWGEVSRRTQAASQRHTLTERLEAAQAELEGLEREATQWGTLYKAFSPSGIPARILAEIAAELTDSTNEVLADLGAGFQVQVTTIRPAKTKGATAREEVSVAILTPDGEAKYASLSGAEKFMVALSVRIALAQCLARRSGHPIETMVLDEGWGNLDPDHRTAMMGMLARLAHRFSIYAITHVEDVRAGFESLIQVSRDETGTSQVTITQAA